MRKSASFALLALALAPGCVTGTTDPQSSAGDDAAGGTSSTVTVGGSSGVANSGHAGTASGSAGKSSVGGGGVGGSGVGTGGVSSAGANAGGTSGSGSTSLAGAAGMAAAGASGSQPFKGVAYDNATGKCPDLSTLGVSWFYNWSSTTTCTGPDYVPQIWGSWKTLTWVPTPAKAVSKGAKELLGFNEPDGAGQANMTVADALALWPDFDQPGVLIGSPATAGQGDWMQTFMAGVATQNLRVDFIAVHWYGWDPSTCNDTSALEGKIKWAEQWNRPIWITEWSCRLQDATVIDKFFTDALAMFKNHPLVVRYAWFETRSNPTDMDFTNAALLDANGAPTALGTEYIAAPSTH